MSEKRQKFLLKKVIDNKNLSEYDTHMGPDQYSTTEICKALDIKYGRLREWVDRGYVTPSQRAEGSGDRTFFSKYGVYIVALFKHLIEVEGFDRQVAGERVQGVKGYLDLARTWEEVKESAYIIFSREPWKPAPGDYRNLRAVCGGDVAWHGRPPRRGVAPEVMHVAEAVEAEISDMRRRSKPTVSIVTENMVKDMSMFDILSYAGFYQRWDDFESLTIVNFKKIREMVDLKLG
jgi:DNA-binding transcriptional MerR regulator